MSETGNNGEFLYPASAPRLKPKEAPKPFNALDVVTFDSAVEIISRNRIRAHGKEFVYKRPLTPSEKDARQMHQMGLTLGSTSRDLFSSEIESLLQPATKEQAIVHARELREVYNSFQLALAGHTADTIVIVGHSTDKEGNFRNDYHAQIFQEVVTPIDKWLGIDFTPTLIMQVRGKKIEELKKAKSSELREIGMKLEESKEAIGRLQQAFVQSILLGLIPDLIMVQDREANRVTDAGILLNSSNIGVNKKGKFVFFDLGTSRADVLDTEARKRLHNFMVQRARSPDPELPIIVEEFRTSGRPSMRDIKLADWYRAALEDELRRSEKKASHPNFKITPDKYLDFINRAITLGYQFKKGTWQVMGGKDSVMAELYADGKIDAFGTTVSWWPQNLAFELDWLQKLSGEMFGTYQITDRRGTRMIEQRETPQIFIDRLIGKDKSRPKGKKNRARET